MPLNATEDADSAPADVPATPGFGAAPKVRLVSISDLLPAPWNPREIAAPDFEELKRSLLADPGFLYQRPVLAQADGTVYAGNMRLRAAMDLGWKTVPAIVEDVTDIVARERAIRDNNNSGVWSASLLAASIEYIKAQGGDPAVLAFKPSELAALLATRPEPEPPASFASFDGDIPTEYVCPKCSYSWSGAPK